MKKKIEDYYLHLYLGCECMVDEKLRVVLCGFEQNGHNIYKPVIRPVNYCGWDNKMVNDLCLIKPILRPLSDMTEQEYNYYISLGCDTGTMYGDIKLEAKRSNYLRSIFIDVDGLIESGLAIDKTTLK